QGGGDELLPAEAGVDAHQQDHVDLVHHVPEHIQRGRRIEYQPGFGAAIADQLQGSVDMVAGFRVEGDVTGPASRKSPMMRSTGRTIRWTSIGADTPYLRRALQTMGPMVRLGTEWLSIRSKWTMSAPAARTR